jgi:hypothetical protein
MGKHGTDKKAAKLAASLWNAGKRGEARRVIATMSPQAQQEIVNRVIKGLQLRQGRH